MPEIGMKRAEPMPLLPFWETTDHLTVRLYSGHVISMLERMPASSVHTCITSPPYWGLRDYGADKTYEIGSEPIPDCGTQGKKQCGKCFVCTMVAVFREVKRVLRSDGTLWLNLGCGYMEGGQLDATHWKTALALQADGWILRSDIPWIKRSCMPESVMNRPAKSLEYIFLFSKDSSYYFDMEAIKGNGNGRASGNKRYKYDGLKGHETADGILDVAHKKWDTRNFRQTDLWFQSISDPHGFVGVEGTNELVGLDVTNQGYEGAHYATFPPKLITPMIKAATSEKGCCVKCGCPWKRMVSEGTGGTKGADWSAHRDKDQSLGVNAKPSGQKMWDNYSPGKTIGWEPGCSCNGRFILQKVKQKVTRRIDDEDANDRDHSKTSNRNGKGSTTLDKGVPVVEIEEEVEKFVYEPRIPLEEHPIKPCVVLDPFIGSGTTCAVCIELDRRSIGIDLNEKYLTNNAIVRIKGVLLSRPALAHLAGVKRVNQLSKNK